MSTNRPKTYNKRPKPLTDEEKIIKLAKERYKRARDEQSDENTRFRFNKKFAYLPDEQWPKEMRQKREIDGRPCETVNRFPVFIRSVVNNWKMNTSGVKVMPADNGADVKTAEILTGLIRNIETQSNASQIKGYAFGEAVAGNKGFYRIVTEYIPETFQQQILIKPIINTECVAYDCDDDSLDGLGWKWCFVEDMLSEEEFKDKYPDKELESWSSTASDGWYHSESKKIRIAEYFYKEMQQKTMMLLDNGSIVYEDDLQEGMNVIDSRVADVPIVKWCVIGGNSKELLEKGDWAGRYIPVVPVWGDQQYIDGKRILISALEYSHGAQRMLNYWRSSEIEALGLSNKAPYVVTTTQIQGHEEKWKNANRQNFSYLEYNPDPQAPPPQRQGFVAPPSGLLAGAANAAQDLMDTSGIQEAGLGMQSNETSGRAINARAAQADKATFQFLDNINHSDRACGVILVDLIPRIIDTPQVVRILGVDGSEKMQPVNQPVEERDKQGNQIEKIYDLSVGKYDVIVSTAPSFASLRQEAQEHISNMVQGNPQLMATHGDLIFKSMDMPYAEEWAERTKKTMPPELIGDEQDGPQIPQEIQMQMEQMGQQLQEMDAALQSKEGEEAYKMAELQLKSRELDIKEMEAQAKMQQASQKANVSVSAEVPFNPENDLSEADKLELAVAEKVRLKEMDQEHAIEMKILEARLNKLKDKKDDLETVDDMLEDAPSETAIALSNEINNTNQGLYQLADALESIVASENAAKEIIKDDKGRISIIGNKRIIRDDAGNPIRVEVLN